MRADNEQYQSSIEAAEEALSLAQALKEYRFAAEQQVLLAFNYRDLDQAEKAIQYCTDALESYKSIDHQAIIDRHKPCWLS